MPSAADTTVGSDQNSNQESHTMKNWVLGAILLGIAVFSYISVFLKMS